MIEVKARPGLDNPIDVICNGIGVCLNIDEAEELKGCLEDAIAELCIENENVHEKSTLTNIIKNAKRRRSENEFNVY